jgi:RNA polymerase sigma factor (sigma-70 family)
MLGVRCPDPSTVDDLIQETLLSALQRRPEGSRNPWPYMYTIVGRKLIDHLREIRRQSRIVDSLARASESIGGAGVTDDVETRAARVSAIARVIDWLETQPPQVRSIFELRFSSGISQRESANRLRLSRAAIRSVETNLQRTLREPIDLPRVRGEHHTARHASPKVGHLRTTRGEQDSRKEIPMKRLTIWALLCGLCGFALGFVPPSTKSAVACYEDPSDGVDDEALDCESSCRQEYPVAWDRCNGFEWIDGYKHCDMHYSEICTGSGS